jgi:hypothetical protein
VKELGSGLSRVETLSSLGVRPVTVGQQRKKADSINGSRLLIPQCWFDAEKCERGINALRNYRRAYDEKLKAFKDHPLHDWSSHGADAFAELAAGKETVSDTWGKPIAYPKNMGSYA